MMGKDADLGTINESGAEAILAAGRQIAGAELLTIEGVEHLIVHKDMQVHNLAKLSPTPQRATGSIALASPESFLAYVGRHHSLDCVIYGDRDAARLTAVLNDHAEGSAPGWRDHRATFQAEASEAWKAWKPLHRKPVPQMLFCDFLEDHLPDVMQPAGGELLELLRDLRGRKDVAWSSGVNLDNGDVQLSYQETTTAESSRKGMVVIPREIVLALEVYRGVPHYKLPCRLRYRVNEGALSFVLVIDQLAEVEQSAFRDLLKMIKDGLPQGGLLVEGKPD